ncbi:hypothetical protein IFT43_20480 [Oxalobacteraceae sp. CFBP 13708]|nr:hypothetical protein [Oxalobacteraceae sp. CFBP 13708]
MKERPILFSGAMVRALLAGSKTQTRRAVKQQPPAGHSFAGWCVSSTHRPDEGKATWVDGEGPFMRSAHRVKCPYGQPGDRLWVRETWRGVVEISPPGQPVEHGVARYVPNREHCRRVEYAATQAPDREPWRPSIHMPRWASRILLEIVSVRVERLQDCCQTDAISEGALHIRNQAWDREHFPAWRYLFDEAVAAGKKPPIGPSPVQAYQALWESINGTGSWCANPWVWVVEFKRVAS